MKPGAVHGRLIVFPEGRAVDGAAKEKIADDDPYDIGQRVPADGKRGEAEGNLDQDRRDVGEGDGELHGARRASDTNARQPCTG